jgi:hypothetical protein
LRIWCLALALVGFVGGLSPTGPAFAATVQVLSGQVLINRGQGYHMVQGATEAGPGDTVVVNPGGVAQIVYSNGCTIKVLPQSVVAIAPQSPCQAEQPPPEPPPPDGQAISTTTLVVGGVAIAGGAVAAVLLLKSKPASP